MLTKLLLIAAAAAVLIGALIMAFMMNRELAAVILVVIPILVILIGIVIKTAFPRFTIMQKKLDTLNSGIQEALTNVRVIIRCNVDKGDATGSIIYRGNTHQQITNHQRGGEVFKGQ